MFLNLKHKELDAYKVSKILVKEIYLLSGKLPFEERFNMVQQLRRAGLSVKLNLAEGCSRRSGIERKRFFEVARGSAIEIDATLETAFELGYLKNDDLNIIGDLLNRCFAMLTKMISNI
jgi:four helix bundle protein